ncbi:hypothetical protein BGX30_005470 [Mortierella sp. GBA39]|nr:hypothetical protein BGX30_005470 [Mortierella sp. GBA39]
MSNHPLAPSVDPSFVYKLISPASTFSPSDKVLPLSALDKADGFYHLSTSAQVPGTANRFFPKSKFNDLLILKIKFEAIKPQVKWEAAKGEHPTDVSRIFPHVYGDLLQGEAIVGTILCEWDEEAEAWDFSSGWEDRLQKPPKMLSKILPDIATQYGLRQYQLTIIGFVVIHGFLHTALFMDGMVSHLFFVLEIISLIYIYFFPAEYTVRPLSKLRNQIPIQLTFAALWASHHIFLPLQGNVSLFSPKEVLLEEVAKTLRRNAGQEAVIVQDKQEGQEQGDAILYTPYANQMAIFMGGLGGLSVLIAAWFIIEAFLVMLKYFAFSQVEKDKKAKAAPAAAAKKDN